MRKNGSLTDSVSVRYRVWHDSYLTFFLGNLNHSKWRHFLGCSVCVLSCFMRVLLFATLWTVAGQARLFKVFSRKEYWSGLSCPPPGNLPNSGIKAEYLTGGLFPVVGRLFCNVLQVISVVIYSASLHQMSHLMHTRTSYLILFLLLKSHAIVLSI